MHPPTPGRITPARAKKILSDNEMQVSETQAESILTFLQLLAGEFVKQKCIDNNPEIRKNH